MKLINQIINTNCLLLLFLATSTIGMDAPQAPSLGTLPDPIKELILQNLVAAKGSTEEVRLFKAVENIRSLLMSNKSFQQFNNDFAFNNFIITELAKRYTGNDKVKAAIALNTSGAGMWLHEEAQRDERVQKLLITAFVDAAGRGQLGIVRFLLKYVPEYKDSAQHQGFTPLKAACVNNRKEIVKELLDNNALPAGDALLLASLNGNPEIVSMLLSKGAAPAFADNQGFISIHAAAEKGHTKVIDLLLKSHPGLVNMPNIAGNTPLILAAALDHPDSLKRLLQAGAQIDHVNTSGNTALMAAAQDGHVSIVETLLAHHANPNIADRSGMSALMYAANNNQPKIVALLIKAAADINQKNASGGTAFLFATQSGDIESVELLLRMKVDINQTNTDGNNALIAAVALGRLPIVKKLLASGINIKHKNNAGQSALDIARLANTPNKDAIIKLLEEAETKAP